MIGHAVLDKQIGQAGHHIITPQTPGNDDPQTLPAELIQHHQHLQHLAVISTILDKVVAPDMVLPARAKPDAGSVVQPEPSPFGLSTGNLQPLTPPDPFDTAKAHLPALQAEQTPDPAIAIAAIHPGQLNNRLCEIRFVITTTLLISLGRAVLTDDATSTALRNAKRRSNVINTGLATRGA